MRDGGLKAELQRPRRAFLRPADHNAFVLHKSFIDLEAAVAAAGGSPTDAGTVELIVVRPAPNERAVVDEGRLDVDEGLVGDEWARRASRSPNAPGAQLTLMNVRVIGAVAGSRDRWPLAGDQLYVDLDLSVANLPPGTRLDVGSATIEVIDLPHTGCGKFRKRYGADARRFVNDRIDQRRRGMNTRVVESGTVRAGDPIRKL